MQNKSILWSIGLLLLFNLPLSAQCVIDCIGRTEIVLPESGRQVIALTDVLDSIPADCEQLDNLQVLPQVINCSLVDQATPYEVIDLTTDSVVCSGIIEVKDTTAPVVVCRDTVVVYLPEDGRSKELRKADFVVGILDECNRNLPLDFTPEEARCNMVRRPEPYYITSRESGDTVCTGFIEVRDTTPARIDCKEQVTVELPSSGFPAIIYPPTVVNSYTDNCTRLNRYNVYPNLLYCEDVGVPTTYYVVDRQGTDTICSGIIEVVDNSIPTVHCVDSISVYLPSDGSPATVDPTLLALSIEDNCSDASDLSVLPKDTFTCADANRPISYALYFNSADSVLCSGVIEVIDTSEQITCLETITVTLPLVRGGFELTPELLLNGSNYGCKGYDNLEVTPSAVFCFDAGQEMEYQIRYAETEDVACSGTLLIEDSSEPLIICEESVSVYLGEDGSGSSLVWQDVVLNLVDNCLNYNDLQVTPGFVDCSDINSVDQYYVIAAPTGDTLCSGALAVLDTVSTSIVCKDTVVVTLLDNGFPGILFPPSVVEDFSDNCSGLGDYMVTPNFFYCPDSAATYELFRLSDKEQVCTGTVIVEGPPSTFGNCGDNATGAELHAANNLQVTQELLVYPNPTSGDLQLLLPADMQGELQYTIYNILGRQLQRVQTDYTGGPLQVDLQLIPSGSYWISVEKTGMPLMNKPFIKSR